MKLMFQIAGGIILALVILAGLVFATGAGINAGANSAKDALYEKLENATSE